MNPRSTTLGAPVKKCSSYLVFRRRFLSRALGLGVLALGGPLRAESEALPAPLEKLLEEFRKSPGFSANFVEEKRILLLKEPVRNEGRMYFAQPRSFARWVDRPFPSQVLLLEQRRSAHR